MKWHDEYDGHGEHYFDYNHGNAYKEPAGYKPAPAYGPPHLASEQQPEYVSAPDSAEQPQFRI